MASRDALVVLRDALLMGEPGWISALALKSRIATFGPSSELAGAGSLPSCGQSLYDAYRHKETGGKVILAGAKPADLPVEQPTVLDRVPNLKAAKALGFKLPQSLLI